MGKSAEAARRRAGTRTTGTGKADKPVMRNNEREFLRQIIIETIDALSLPSLIRAAVAECTGSASPLTPSAQGQPSGSVAANPIQMAHQAVEAAQGRLNKAFDRWYKTNQQVADLSPLDPGYPPVAYENTLATHDLLEAANSRKNVATGIVSV